MFAAQNRGVHVLSQGVHNSRSRRSALTRARGDLGSDEEGGKGEGRDEKDLMNNVFFIGSNAGQREEANSAL